MKISRLQQLCSFALLTALAGMSSPLHAAALDIAQKPLYLGSSIQPAFIMAVDNSGSMTFETLFPGSDGQAYWDTDTTSFFTGTRLRTQDDSGNDLASFHYVIPGDGHPLSGRYAIPPLDVFGFARTSDCSAARNDCNPAYFDPSVTYNPWLNYDGSAFADASTTATRYDARNAGPTLDLTALTRNRTDDEDEDDDLFNEDITIASGEVLLSGWQIRNQGSGNQTCTATPSNLVFGSSGGGYTTLTQDYTLTQNCDTVRVRRTRPDNPDTDERFVMPQGAVLPAGTVYNVASDCGGLGTRALQRNVWLTLPAAHTMTQHCYVGIEYFPATFFLKQATPAPAGYNAASRTLVNNACGAGCNLYKYEIKPANYATTADYNAAIQNFANWLSFYGDRNRSMIAALTHSLIGVNFMRIGFFTINPRSSYPTLTMRDMATASDRQALYTSLHALNASGGTPNRWAVQHIGEQFKRQKASDAGAPVQLACQINAGMLFTDGYSNDTGPTVGNIDGSSPLNVAPFTDSHSNTLADIASKYYVQSLNTGLPDNQVPIEPACNSANPPKQLDCRNDPHVNFYGVTLGARGDLYGVTHVKNEATGLIAPDPFVTAPTWGVREDDQPSTVDEIWHATLNTRGQYINASTPADITEAMNDVIQAVTESARRSGGTAASSARRTSGFSAFVPEFNSVDWTGDVVAYKLTAGGGLGDQRWSASAKLPAHGSRNIFVSLPTGVGTAKELKPFTFANVGGTGSGAESTARTRLGLTSTDFASGNVFAGRTVADVIEYLRGKTDFELRNGGKFRNRSRVFGDVINSQPALLERGSEGHTLLPVGQGGGKNADGSYLVENPYKLFVDTKQTRTPVLFVGSNDGMLHALNASNNSGVELFAVIPNSVLAKTGGLAKPSYDHTYFVDASPNIADACIGTASGVANCSWKSVLLTGMGAGGRSVLALDVTNPASSFGVSNFLWEFTDADLGLTFGKPKVFPGENGTWYAAFGNGYNSDNYRAYLYIVNLKTGAQVAKIAAGTAGSVSDPNGLNQVTMVDVNGNGYADTAYAADYHGKVWKFDLSSTNTGAWTTAFSGSPLYTALARNDDEVGATKRQVITGAIAVSSHHLGGLMVYFGTGKYLLKGPVSDSTLADNPQEQTFYGVWDNGAAVADRTQLQAQTVSAAGATLTLADGTQVASRITTANTVDYATKKGWYIDLYVSGNGDGERFIGEPTVQLGRTIFTTFTPSSGGPCQPGGKNRLYSLDALSGAANLTLAGCTGCGAVELTAEESSQPPAVSPPIIVDPNAGVAVDSDGDGINDNDESDVTCTIGDPGCTDSDGDGTPDIDESEGFCYPGIDPGCRALPSGDAPVTGKTCLANLAALLNNGTQAFSQVTCGRQSWRQVQ